MKKRVTFAGGQMIHRLHGDDTLQRNSGMKEQKTDNQITGLKDVAADFNGNRRQAARTEPQIQHVTVQIPKTVSTGPFLKHSALTPAQRKFLFSVSSSSSSAHVRGLITQHYMNVLHRCIRADDLAVTSVTSPDLTESRKHQTLMTRADISSKMKHNENIHSAKHPEKSFLPKLPNNPVRWETHGRGLGPHVNISGGKNVRILRKKVRFLTFFTKF
ncbi:uncharacterized protein LOC131444415 [Solea solea]|uniref:uncharacterized protein LOC131444415 n=1 Tax=Solea solea TaxID=90069 RepID=UPI00272AEA7C|nr:uncharacterized protein LOC131444415 [Solea solea]